jgi:threonine dehydratase
MVQTTLSAMTFQIPTYQDILQARLRIRPYLSPTPLREYPSLSKLMNSEVYVKHENHLPTGAFKIRGGINLMSQLSQEERKRGVITASTGNHGQSVAYAARLFGVKAIICVPNDANPVKVESMINLEAEIIPYGSDFDEAREYCERLAIDNGYRYIHSGNEPQLIAGVATATVEILEEQPCIDLIFVPVGGGSGAAGACIAAKGMHSKTEVIAVQSEAAPAGYRSWTEHRLVEDRMATRAEGLATRTAFQLPQQILWEYLEKFLLVSEDELLQATRLMIEKTRTLVEAAGAASLAGAIKFRDELEGKKIALICSGGNISLGQLRDLLQ